MNDRPHEKTLARAQAPAPGAAARERAHAAALAEFTRAHAANDAAAAQDSADSPRPSRIEQRGGRFMMDWTTRRSLFGTFASMCVVAFATAMLWPVISWRATVRDIEETQMQLAPEAPPPSRSSQELPPSQALPPPTSEPPHNVAVPHAANVPRLKSETVAAQPAPVIVPVASMPANAASSPSGVDQYQAQDIGEFRDKNAAGSLQRISEQGASGGTHAPISPAELSRIAKRLAKKDQKPDAGFVAEGDDKFEHFDTNPVKRVAEEPVSTFSADVDTSSYSFVRRMLNEGRLPQKDSVRAEEMVNYFDYAWPKAESRDAPFEPTIAVTDSPWTRGRKLVHIGIKGYDVPRDKAPDVNLVLLLDVSGSMDSPDKLPLAVQSMELLLGSLKPTDTVGIVVYAGNAGTVLEPTPVKDKQKIIDALRTLTPGGSTAGAEGIERAYELAQKNFRKGGVNRVLLATDGDFNVGIDSTEELKGYVERQREKGVMLSVLGFGEGNYRDEMAQALAQNGNGIAAYIDTLSEAQKVLVDQSSGALFTIAKDVKIQVEFNPAAVEEYRLVGYETRALKREDFNNDAVDAGDVGSGHTVTAIYEITPVGSAASSVDALRYGTDKPADARAAEYGFVKIRYKLPSESKSRLISKPMPVEQGALAAVVAREVKFSTAVAGFAQLLRGGKHTGTLSYDDVIAGAQAAKGDDPFGYRTEFVQLVRKAKTARGM